MKVNQQRRWLLALIIIAAVIIASAGIALSYRDKPGSIPMRAISDGSGGTIVAWQEERGIYIQHIDASGKHLWQEGGITVTEAGIKLDPFAPSRTSFSLIADGSGGVIITWDDRYKMPTDRNDPAFFNPIPFHSQRISSAGELLWNNTELAAGGAGLYGGSFPVVVADGTGGAIFAWNAYATAYRALHNDFLRLQRLAPDGNRLWGEQGKLLVSSSPYRPLTEDEKTAGIKGTVIRSYPTYAGAHDIVSDGAGGVIVIWEEEGEHNANLVYAQRLDSDGRIAWNEKVIVGTHYQDNSMHSDGSGGAILAATYLDTGVMYQQHIGSDGALLEKKDYFPDMISDGFGGSYRVRVAPEPSSGPPAQRRMILYVQRINPAVSSFWPEKQVLATEPRYQIGNLEYAADGTGGIILLWQFQKEFVAYGGTFAQKVDGEGNTRWGETGIPVFNEPNKYQANGTIISDGSGGAIVIAVAGNNALGGDMVYAQRLDAEGNRLWGDGIRLDR
ncbi:MAG: hypothetical protein PHF12_00310 [Candidatus Omnitrophica bacterium]|nr:hypothetical protein [Candidatus Omnitrophota bacterium]